MFDISVVSHPSIIFENKMADYQHFQDFNEINENNYDTGPSHTQLFFYTDFLFCQNIQ